MFNEFMSLAIKQAEKARDKGEIPVGAVIVRNGEIIAVSHNLKETEKNAAAHAEINAIALAGKKLGRWQLYDCDLYVTLQPCNMCKAAIEEARINSVYFGAYDNNTEFVMKDTTVYGGIMEDQCTKILLDFFGKIR